MIALYSGRLSIGLKFGMFCGGLLAVALSLYFLFGLVLFEKKRFFYSNIPEQLQLHNIREVFLESIAGNTTGLRIKYGCLLLTDKSIIFITHKFAKDPLFLDIPLKTITKAKESNINLLKMFSAGLRKRLLIETKTGERYEFSVWNMDEWTTEINNMSQVSTLYK
jgi:hypothetical protein